MMIECLFWGEVIFVSIFLNLFSYYCTVELLHFKVGLLLENMFVETETWLQVSKSIQVRVYVVCLSSTCSSHRQITIHAAGWSSQHLFFGQKSRSLFWWIVHGRTRQPIGSFMLLPIAPRPIHPTLPDDHGGNTPHELIHHRQSG